MHFVTSFILSSNKSLTFTFFLPIWFISTCFQINISLDFSCSWTMDLVSLYWLLTILRDFNFYSPLHLCFFVFFLVCLFFPTLILAPWVPVLLTSILLAGRILNGFWDPIRFSFGHIVVFIHFVLDIVSHPEGEFQYHSEKQN